MESNLIQTIDTVSAIISHSSTIVGTVIFVWRWLWLEWDHKRRTAH